jgi:hypothetical protein
MQLSNLPARILQAFANAGSKNTIPQTTATPGAASFNQGFPALTMTPLSAGGVPPAGQDFNGILYALSLIQQWQSAGGTFSYDSAWSTANNGYPKGAVLLRADGTGFWLNTTDNNTADPDGATPTGWVPEFQDGVTAITGLTNANVTLTSLQYGRRIITLAGTLTGNVQIIFPAFAGQQWLLVNNTTGAFTVTAKTAAGTGPTVPQNGGAMPVWGNGTDIKASGTGRFIARRIISATGTYTPTPGTAFALVTLVAGGGGGGGSAATGAGQCAAGAGGGGGGWAFKTIVSPTPVTVTIGGGGAGGVGAVGSNGGTSSYGAVFSASPGGGGALGGASATSPVSLNGSGAQGAGSGGDVNFTGGIGAYAIYTTNPISGRGGFSYGGDGAAWVVGGYVSGLNGPSWGAGGSGSAATASQGIATGGAGYQGICIIDEFV